MTLECCQHDVVPHSRLAVLAPTLRLDPADVEVVDVVFRHRSVLAAPAQLEASTRSASPNLEERATATTPAQSSCLKREGSPSYGPHSPGPAALEGV